jgi:hypothetical protein
MTYDEFMAIEVARYIGIGMDLQAARSLAAWDWTWSGGKTYDMRVAEARERVFERRIQQKLHPTADDEDAAIRQWDAHSPEANIWWPSK